MLPWQLTKISLLLKLNKTKIKSDIYFLNDNKTEKQQNVKQKMNIKMKSENKIKMLFWQ